MDALAFHVAATGGATTPANLGRLLLVCTAQFQPFLILFFFFLLPWQLSFFSFSLISTRECPSLSKSYATALPSH
jgi:hypothetical protein